MTPQIAAALFAAGIAVLFALNREPKSKTSKALWLPVFWLFIAGSRMVSQWISFTPQAFANSSDGYLDGNPMDRNILASMVGLAVIVLISRGPKVGRFLRANWPIVLYFSYGLVSLAWSDFPDVALKHWVKAAGDFTMVLLVWTDPDPVAALKRLLSRVGFLLMPLSILFIKYIPDLGRSYDPGFGFWMPTYTGVTTTKNLLGMITLICGLGALWRLLQQLRAQKKDRKYGLLLAQGVLLGMVMFLFWRAQSMTSMACFAMASSLMVVMGFRVFARRLAVMHVLVLAVLTVAVSALFLNTGSGLLETMGRDPTLTGRTDVWRTVLSVADRPLLGTGFESFWLGPRLEKIWAVFWWHPNEAHDGYLEVYLNLGWVGVGLLAIVIVAGYRNVVRAFRQDRTIGQLRLAYFIAALNYNFTESAFRMLHPVWFIFLLSAAAVPEIKMRTKARKKKVAANAAILPPVPALEEA
jgi:exopolysaccharide production protein ExoQ